MASPQEFTQERIKAQDATLVEKWFEKGSPIIVRAHHYNAWKEYLKAETIYAFGNQLTQEILGFKDDLYEVLPGLTSADDLLGNANDDANIQHRIDFELHLFRAVRLLDNSYPVLFSSWRGMLCPPHAVHCDEASESLTDAHYLAAIVATLQDRNPNLSLLTDLHTFVLKPGYKKIIKHGKVVGSQPMPIRVFELTSHLFWLRHIALNGPEHKYVLAAEQIHDRLYDKLGADEVPVGSLGSVKDFLHLVKRIKQHN